MKVLGIVPVKELNPSKRLHSVVLTQEERDSLTAAMLEGVLKGLMSSVVREIVVVGSGSMAQKIAEKHCVSYLSEGRAGLGQAIQDEIELCLAKKSDAILILPAYVPLLSSKDVDKIVALGSEKPTVVLSPSLGGGMSALFLNPSNVIEACFGEGCFSQNVEAAIKKGIAVKFHSSRAIALNMDSEEDLPTLLETENNTMTKRVFQKIVKQKKEDNSEKFSLRVTKAGKKKINHS